MVCSHFMCGEVKHVKKNREEKVYFTLMDYMLEKRGVPRPTFERKMKASSMISSTALLQIYYRYSHLVFTFFNLRSVIMTLIQLNVCQFISLLIVLLTLVVDLIPSLFVSPVVCHAAV